MTTPTITPDVAEALGLHHLAADARVRRLNLDRAGLALSSKDIEAKHDAENDLGNHLVRMRETIRREAIAEVMPEREHAHEELSILNHVLNAARILLITTVDHGTTGERAMIAFAGLSEACRAHWNWRARWRNTRSIPLSRASHSACSRGNMPKR